MNFFTLRRYFLICLAVGSILPGLYAQDTAFSRRSAGVHLGKNIKLSGLFYLAGQVRSQDTISDFAFQVRRAYLTVEAGLTKNLSVRYTQDITIDAEGRDAGNVELRIKYLYAQYKLPAFWIFSDNKLKFGIIHRPWIDFEEHINAYRVEGTMFMERSHLFNSSGFGLSFQGYFGGVLQGEYAKKVHPHDAGKYGSFAFGLYNGGGYHQFEKNLNKNFEVRVTLRPFPEKLPGLQFSYNGLFGRGNIPQSPVFRLNAGFVSYQGQYFTLTAQYEKGLGNSYGTFVDSTFRALPHRGYSFYGELKIPRTRIALYGRYDHFILTASRAETNERQIYGISWRFFKGNKLVFSCQNGKSFGQPRIRVYDMALDISF